MRGSITLLWLLVVALWPSSVVARLGETNVEIAKRYGAVAERTQLSTNLWIGTYKAKGFVILVYFKENKSIAEAFGAQDQRNLTQSEKDALMQSVGGPGTWEPAKTLGVSPRTWRNSTSRCTASVSIKTMGGDTLLICSDDNADLLKRAITDQARKNISSF